MNFLKISTPIILFFHLALLVQFVLCQHRPLGLYNMRDVEGKTRESHFASESIECNEFRRNPNGVCTNLLRPVEGARDTAQFSYVDGERREVLQLYSARMISSLISTQAKNKNMYNKYGLTDFTTFFGQFLDHNLVHTDTDSQEPMDINIPYQDSILKFFPGRSMPFLRSVLVSHPKSSSLDSSVTSPVNCLSSAIDLSGVYGSKDMVAAQLRTGQGGLMKSLTYQGKEYLPLLSSNTDVMMALPKVSAKSRRKFFAAGDTRANENMVLASFHTLFLREHNRLARILKLRISESEMLMNSDVGDSYDDGIYQLAKRLNEAQFQGIVALEYVPQMTGQSLQSPLKHDDSESPALSDVFTTVAFRVGHSMVGNRIQLRNQEGQLYKSIPLKRLFFTKANTLLKTTIEHALLGAMFHRAQEIDTNVVHDLRNFLFKKKKGLDGAVDLLSLNIQRGRDHQLPLYNKIREIVDLPRVYSFGEITTDHKVWTALSAAYNGNIELVEGWVGMMAEDHAPGSPVGPTLQKFWILEFSRVLAADRFLFTKPDSYHPLLKKKMGNELNQIMQGKRTMQAIIEDNTDIRFTQSLKTRLWRV